MRQETARDVGELLELHSKTVKSYAAAGCPHDTGPRGVKLFSVDEVEKWMQQTGRTGEPGRPDDGALPPDYSKSKFWEFYVPLERMADDDERLITPIEAAVLDGSRTMTQAELVKYVDAVVTLKQGILREVEIAARWTGPPEHQAERGRRLRASLYEPLIVLSERMAVWRVKRATKKPKRRS